MPTVATQNSPAKRVLRFKARVENGVIIPVETISLPSGQTYLVTLQAETKPTEAAPLDALAEIAAMAQPLGPADLARNFDTYAGRVLNDEPAL